MTTTFTFVYGVSDVNIDQINKGNNIAVNHIKLGLTAILLP